jgi:hypothetical protein
MSRRRARAEDPVTKTAKAVAYPFRVKSKLEAFIRPAARVVGALGLVLLVGCVVLWRLPAEQWPRGLVRERLPTYVIVSLAVASLLGWAFVSDGQKRVRRAVGRPLSLALFVVVPIAFAYLGFVGPARIASWGGPAKAHWIWTLVRWYGPVVVVASLVAFLTWKSRGRYDRGAWFALLVAPYVALLAFLVFGVRFASIDEAHRAALTTLGSWAVALQLTLGFFVGGRD